MSGNIHGVTRRPFQLVRRPLLNGSSQDMAIDGASSPVTFAISGESGKAIYIDKIKFTLIGRDLKVDSNDLYRFGEATAKNSTLTNGVLLRTTNTLGTTDIFYNPVKTIMGFLDYAEDVVNLVNFSGSTDLFSFSVKFRCCVPLFSSSDNVSCIIRDDLTDLTDFYAMVFGRTEVL